jgi:hypothetical protein
VPEDFRVPRIRQASEAKKQLEGAVCGGPRNSVVEIERSVASPPSSSSYAYEESSGSVGRAGIEVILLSEME